MRLERVGMAEPFAAEHARIRERVVVDAPVPLVVAVVGERRVAVRTAVGPFSGMYAPMGLHALQVVERRAAQVAQERPRRDTAQQVTAQSGVLRERPTAARAGECVRRRMDRHVLFDVRKPVRAVVAARMAARERAPDAVDHHRVSFERHRLGEVGRALAAVEEARRVSPFVSRQYVGTRKLLPTLLASVDRVVACRSFSLLSTCLGTLLLCVRLTPLLGMLLNVLALSRLFRSKRFLLAVTGRRRCNVCFGFLVRQIAAVRYASRSF